MRSFTQGMLQKRSKKGQSGLGRPLRKQRPWSSNRQHKTSDQELPELAAGGLAAAGLNVKGSGMREWDLQRGTEVREDGT